MKRTHIPLFLLAILGFLPLSQCKKEPLGVQSNSKVFDPTLFKTRIQLALNGAVGYTLVINQGGVMVEDAAFGTGSINASNGSGVAPTIDQDVNIASVTKPLTAMATLGLMEDRGQLLHFPIGLWLPNSWVVHPDVQAITFEELLSHTSGLRMAFTSYDSLQAVVGRPITASKTYSYANANFGLLRPILAKMRNTIAFNNQEASLSTADFRSWVSQQYMAVMNERVFSPAGISNAQCDVDPGTTTIQAFCELPNQNLNPISFGDWTNLSGGGGYYLTTREMAQIMAYLVHTTSILTLEQKIDMDQGLLGWDPNDCFTTNYGRSYGKDGFLYRDDNGDGQITAGESGLQTWVGKFPNGVEVALVVNSIGTGTRSLGALVDQAYEDAWVEQ